MQTDTLRPALELGLAEERAARRRIPSLLTSHGGAAAFGVAMAFSTQSANVGESLATWALALPLVCTCTWLMCLPALYIPWAAREPRLSVSSVGKAALDGVAVFGTCLGATAPIQWFFAVTAPASGWLSALGFIFVWLAVIAASVTFSRSLEAASLKLPGWAQLLFFALFVTTFFQFGHIAGLRFFHG